MNTIQAKLQECINSGQLNSFDRLSNLFAGKSETDGNDDAMETNIPIKDDSKIPTKKSSSKKHSMTGMLKHQKKLTKRNLERRELPLVVVVAVVAVAGGAVRLEWIAVQREAVARRGAKRWPQSKHAINKNQVSKCRSLTSVIPLQYSRELSIFHFNTLEFSIYFMQIFCSNTIHLPSSIVQLA